MKITSPIIKHLPIRIKLPHGGLFLSIVYRMKVGKHRAMDLLLIPILYWNLDGGADYQQPSSSLTEWDMLSYYGRANYNFKDKYLLTFTGRYDGSSRLWCQ